MTTKIQKWGNSQGLRIPKVMLDTVGFSVGQEIEIKASGHQILLKKTARQRRKPCRIEDLLARMPKGMKSLAEVSLKPRGQEVW